MKFTALITHITNVIILQRILNFWLLQPFLTSQHNNTTLTLYKSSISSVMRKSSCLNLSKMKFFQPHFLPSSLFSFSNSIIANWSYECVLFYQLVIWVCYILSTGHVSVFYSINWSYECVLFYQLFYLFLLMDTYSLVVFFVDRLKRVRWILFFVLRNWCCYYAQHLKINWGKRKIQLLHNYLF